MLFSGEDANTKREAMFLEFIFKSEKFAEDDAMDQRVLDEIDGDWVFIEGILKKHPSLMETRKYIEEILYFFQPQSEDEEKNKIYCRYLRQYLNSIKDLKERKEKVLFFSYGDSFQTADTMKLLNELDASLSNVSTKEHIDYMFSYYISNARGHYLLRQQLKLYRENPGLLDGYKILPYDFDYALQSKYTEEEKLARKKKRLENPKYRVQEEIWDLYDGITPDYKRKNDLNIDIKSFISEVSLSNGQGMYLPYLIWDSDFVRCRKKYVIVDGNNIPRFLVAFSGRVSLSFKRWGFCFGMFFYGEDDVSDFTYLQIIPKSKALIDMITNSEMYKEEEKREKELRKDLLRKDL